MEANKGKVCVTGGTGFLASWLIMRDVSFLTSLPGASEKLQIFQADLSVPESFEAAIKGCIGVFHVATPVDYERKEPEEVITRRTIDGTLGILKECLKAKTVKRVVYTSSESAVKFNDKIDVVDTMDESFWSDVDYIKSMNKSTLGSYLISKTLTEKMALEFGEEHGLDIVTVIPLELYGFILKMAMVHTDDVARAHIFLFENPEAKGRYICSSHTITIEELSKFLSAKYPEFPIPTVESLKDIEGYKPPGLSSKKLLDSGFEFKYGLDEIFDGAIQCCKEKGYI
ncbi:hypothetical protein P3X46_024297 [Hevea brasiliensis]|uniref:NAD-dependent epimerase/dehydratase domain-containing protein n=1 Tax=Hevea brasiliensis TaxID=3981 RepID=A0ABQ9L206_HEVBR|nr:hypothetical protein P3X46_024297 [Hevea brasiliensis]